VNNCDDEQLVQTKSSRTNDCDCCNLIGWMIWFFDRDGEKLRYEISRDRADGRYKVVITHPDGSESVEEVDEPTELIERSVELMNSLRGDGWKVA
jgi:hypothetical protein